MLLSIAQCTLRNVSATNADGVDLGITDTDNLIICPLAQNILGKDVPNETQEDIGTNVPGYCVILSLYYNFLYLHNNQP